MSQDAKNELEPKQVEAAQSKSDQTEAKIAAPEKLEGVEEIDFLLEEIESKIAPLALA